MKRQTPKTSNIEDTTPEDKALNDAIDRVYKKYGNNISAFVRDIQKGLAVKRQEADSHGDDMCQ